MSSSVVNRMALLKSIKLVLPTAIALATVVLLSSSSTANRTAISGAKLMTQNSNSDSSRNGVRLPDEAQKRLEAIEREVSKKDQQDREEAFAREMARKTPKEREDMEREIKKIRDNKYAPERKTEEELKREDERAIKILNELKAKRQRE